MSEHRLSEIVIERPRGGQRISARKLTGYRKQLNKLTQEASEDGLLSPYLIKPRYKTKYLSDHLGPLRRFLRSKVGQPWNDVYSELCQQLDCNTVIGQHVLDHLWYYVERHAELIDGVPYSKSYWITRRRLSHRYGDSFYVHPETGILCDAKHDDPAISPTEAASPKPARDIIILDDYHQYRKLNDIWYLITFQEIPETESVFDLLSRTTVTSELKGRCNRLYAAQKQQCNKRELKIIQAKLDQIQC